MTPQPARHVPETNPTALRVEVGGRIIAYTGDTEWTDDVARIAHGADGLLVRQRAGDVAAAILRLLDDPALRAAMGLAGAAKLAERWDWDRVMDRVEAAYALALGAETSADEALA